MSLTVARATTTPRCTAPTSPARPRRPDRPLPRLPPEIPRYEENRPKGSTAEVDFWTSKPVKEVVHSHLNYVVADTRTWEQAAAYYIDNHDEVTAFVKNQGLGFAIPYMDNGQRHDYIPDFIIRLKNGAHLILETKDYDEKEAVKVAATHGWVDAVNAEGSVGTWCYAIARNPNDVPHTIDEMVTQTAGMASGAGVSGQG